MKKVFTLSIALSMILGMSINAQKRVINSENGMKTRIVNVNNANVYNVSQQNSFDVKMTADRSSRARNIVFYDFEDGMPDGFELIYDERPWQVVATDPEGDIPDHDGKFALATDDPNANMSDVWMILPPVYLENAENAKLVFDQCLATYQWEKKTIRVSIDEKETWQTVATLGTSGTAFVWHEEEISLDDFVGQGNLYIAFHYSDIFTPGGNWTYPWAVDNIAIEADLVQTEYDITFNVKNEDSDPLNAKITVKQGETIKYQGVCVNGIITFEDVDGDAYTYDAEFEGYNTISGVAFNADATKTINVTMIKTVHNVVTFNVLNIATSAPVNATVKLKQAGSIKHQGVCVNGTITFGEVVTGNYTYDVEYSGYESIIGVALNVDTDKTVDVKMTAIIYYDISFAVKNKLSTNLNATVSVYKGGEEYFAGDCFSGKITFYDVEEGDYTYNVEYSSYETISGVAFRSDATKTINVEMVEIIGYKPFNLSVDVNGANADFSWSNYGLPMPISYYSPDWRPAQITGWYEDYQIDCVGVVFDLEEYPYAVLTQVDFLQTMMLILIGLEEPCEYKVNIIDINEKKLIYTSPVFSTINAYEVYTWEYVPLPNIDGWGGKMIGVYCEPLTLFNYYDVFKWNIPTVCLEGGDRETSMTYTINKYSYQLGTGIQQYDVGEAMYRLWILTEDGKKVQLGGKSFKNFEVFLDETSKGTTSNKSYKFTNLADGVYDAGVRGVYETDFTETAVHRFTVGEGNIDNVKYLLSYFVDDKGVLTVKTETQAMSLEIYSMDGQLVRSAVKNSAVLPQRGVYAVKANVAGNVVNFKVVW